LRCQQGRKLKELKQGRGISIFKMKGRRGD
jgi:hypothetical protein